MKFNKKGQITELETLMAVVVILAVIGMVGAFTLQILGDVKGDMTANSLEANATGQAQEGIAKIPNKLPIIATVILAGIIIGILVTFLYRRFNR